jgi:hypothetical protein
MPDLDRGTFIREMTLLHDRFGRTPNEHVIARYYDTLRDRLSTREFAAAARVIFDQDAFWPAPARFIELAQGNPKDEAEREWYRLVGACSRGERTPLLSPEGAAAMRAVGGWNAVAYCEGDVPLDRKRTAFLRAFAAAREERDVQARLPAPVSSTALEIL